MAKHLRGFKHFGLIGLEYLRGAKNLLGFSGQVDSSALFYLLVAYNIDFDIAIIDYGKRKQSKYEVKHSKTLAKRYNKKIFIHKADKIEANFEAQARQERLKFFEMIMIENNYANLILANQLNDRLEWFLMQLSKGCGLNSLLGFEAISEWKGFRLIRPLANTPRKKIVKFLAKNHIKYFEDKSNDNPKYLRNLWRKKYANAMIEDFGKGIAKSFEFLKADFDALYGKSKIWVLQNSDNSDDRIFVFRRDSTLINLHNIDICAKKLGYVISQSQRNEIVKANFSCVVADKIIIDINDNDIFVASNLVYFRHDKMTREKMRKAQIPPRIRKIIKLEMIEQISKIRRNDEIGSF